MYKCRDIERTVFNGRLSLIYTVDKFAFMVLKFCSCCRRVFCTGSGDLTSASIVADFFFR